MVQQNLLNCKTKESVERGRAATEGSAEHNQIDKTKKAINRQCSETEVNTQKIHKRPHVHALLFKSPHLPHFHTPHLPHVKKHISSADLFEEKHCSVLELMQGTLLSKLISTISLCCFHLPIFSL